ncbi:MAG: (2Fe-2S)-binding protein [bacterium]|nr:(2Fe-2S)-binding protein [bacterium]
MSDVYICRCEEVTVQELEEAIHNGATIADEVKRFTRAGMGLCQGRTCRKSVERLIAQHTGKELKDITPSNYRHPVRPVKMGAFEEEEGEDSSRCSKNITY